jgi:hypothetical protein
VSWQKVCISHSHLQALVTKHALQRKYVATALHEVTSKGMPKRLTSFAEDLKKTQDEFRQDEKNRELRRASKLPIPEITRETLPSDVIHKQDLSSLLRSGQLIPASALAKQKEDAEKLTKDLEEAVRSEISH